MIQKIRTFISPPTFEDEEKTRLAQVLNIILWVIIIALISFMIIVVMVVDQPWTILGFFIVYLIPSFASLLLMHKGRVRTAMIAFIVSLWVGIALGDAITPGDGSNLTSYMIIIVMAGLLLKGRGALFFTSLTILVKLAIIPLDNLVGAPQEFALAGVFFEAVILGIVTVLLYIASNSIDTALARARRNERALSQKVDELSATTDALAVARDEALAASRAKSQFLANMSHEIRTPLNAVVGMTELLMDSGLDEQQNDFTEIIQKSSNALLSLINDILDFSKIEADRLELEEVSFTLGDCIESSMDIIAPRASEKGIELAYLIEPETKQALVGDVARLRQVLVNLLGNGVKFTESGEVVLTVTSRPLPAKSKDQPERHEWHFAIQDTGIGIAESDINRLFESFSQLDASTTRQFGGTGLGLAISSRLVEKMNGRIWAKSELGRGSTFHFTIQADVADYTPPVYLSKPQPVLNGKRLLVVDDNETNRKIIRLQAKVWQMEIIEAATGSEALELIQDDEPFDLGLLDMSMPEMDGLMLAEEIRAYRDKQTLPLVMLTSIGLREFDDRLTHFAAFLTKPIKGAELFDILAGILSPEITPEQMLRAIGTPATKVVFDSKMGREMPLRILLVEDNELNQNMTLLMLERLGYEADLAVNGQEAVEAVQKQPYDIVLMDVQMPIMDGLTATRRIRRRSDLPNQPYIIALTADVVEKARERCLKAGMDDYIGKPIAVADIVRALKISQGRVEETLDLPPAAPLSSREKPSDENFDPEAIERMKVMLGEKAAHMLPRLIADFYKDSQKLLQDIETAVVQGDKPLLKRAAHSLKSNSAHFGLNHLTDKAKALERAVHKADTENISHLVQNIHTAYSQSQYILDSYLMLQAAND